MGLLVGSKLDEIDDAISTLAKRRRRCTDPVDILLATESIDRLLDDRILLMQEQDGP